MASERAWLDHHKTFMLVTGASRGLGKTLSLRFAPFLGPGSMMLLLARDMTKMEALKREIYTVNPKVKSVARGCDLSQPDATKFRDVLALALSCFSAQAGDFQQVIIVHNAASVGPFKLAEDCSDTAEWDSYLRFNLTSPICLNSAFLKTFPKDVVEHRLVINITSLAAWSPILSGSFYNTGKAARDQFFNTLAKEDPSIPVLSYSPGPLKTDMMDEVQLNILHPTAKQIFTDLKENDKLLSCDQTVSRLLEIIKANSFESGVRIDYFGRD